MKYYISYIIGAQTKDLADCEINKLYVADVIKSYVFREAVGGLYYYTVGLKKSPANSWILKTDVLTYHGDDT